MYDSPKAIHFVAIGDCGEAHHPRDPIALAARWAAATYCGDIDMLRPNLKDGCRIAQACFRAGEEFRLRVQLADDELARWAEAMGIDAPAGVRNG